MYLIYYSALSLLLTIHIHPSSCHYEANWESLDTRPIPNWFDEAKFGIFINWGVYSVPSFGSEWFWWYWQGSKTEKYVDFMTKNYPPGFTYADFASQFTAEFYDADWWAEVVQASGARYVVYSTKHLEGYTLWPSKYSYNWNSMDVGPKRDLVGEFAEALQKKPGIHLGLYHELAEWFNPLFDRDRSSGFKTQDYVRTKPLPELYELVQQYKPDIIWSDGYSGGDSKYWNATEFIAWLYNESPVKETVVVNDRWGSDVMCRHGDYFTCYDRYNPGKLLTHKWENCMTIDAQSWGFRREAVFKDYLTINQLLAILAETISCGGNLLMNIGPTHDGRIVPIYEERLRQMGAWLAVNGEAVYESLPWRHQNDTETKAIWYTKKLVAGTHNYTVYAFVLNWPENNILKLGSPIVTSETTISMLGVAKPLKWTGKSTGIVIEMPVLSIVDTPSLYAWVLKLEGVN